MLLRRVICSTTQQTSNDIWSTLIPIMFLNFTFQQKLINETNTCMVVSKLKPILQGTAKVHVVSILLSMETN